MSILPKVRTGHFVNLVRNTNHSSAYFGACEICNHDASNVSVHHRAEIVINQETQEYVFHEFGSMYGHLSCFIEAYGHYMSKTGLKKSKSGRHFLVPDLLLAKLFSKGDRHE